MTLKITLTTEKANEAAHLENCRPFLENKIGQAISATALKDHHIELVIEGPEWLFPETPAETIAVARLMFGDDPDLKTVGDVRERAQVVLQEMRTSPPQSVLDDCVGGQSRGVTATHMTFDEMRNL